MAGWCEVLEGRLVRGAMLLDRADALLDVGSTSPLVRMVIGHMGPMLRIAIEQRAGRAAAALALARAARAALPDLPVRELLLARGSFVLQEGQVHLELGELDEALAQLEQAVELLRVEPRLVVVPLAHLAQAQRRLGQVEAAQRSLRRALQHAERSGTLDHAGAGLVHLEQAALALERGDVELARRECEAGLEHNRRLRDLTYLNWGTELLARIHAAMGAREDALAVLDEALEQLDDTDMIVARERMQARRRELLAAPRPSPARTGATALDGPDALTGRELEVLDAIASGLGNRDIAQRLFVSLGTIKTHVHRILAKLDVDNRTAAVRRARELGLIA
jgi:ATP/maltotriose-dependent transcriptional regulator MalT